MMRKAIAFVVLLVPFCTSALGQLVVTAEDDPNVLANEILGDGITIIGGSPILTAADGRVEPPATAGIYSAGVFTGGSSTGIGIDEGIILATGNVNDALGPNMLDNTMTMFMYLGCDPDLEWLLTGTRSCDPDPVLNYTKEATILEFEFESNSGNVSFNFVFASDEYNEYVYTNVNDVFGLFVDGENVALIPGTSTYVSIDTVNGGGGGFDAFPYGDGASYPEFYNNNDYFGIEGDQQPAGSPPFNIEYDGFTNVFTATKLDLGPGPHTLKLAISDAGDKQVDSAVFIEADSLTDEPNAEALTCNCSTPGLFDPPMDKDVTVKKGNRVIPLKFDLCDEYGLPITDLDISPPLAEVDYTGSAGELVFEADDFLSVGRADDGNLFVFAGGHWQLNLQTKMFEAGGVYEISAVSTDPDYVIDPTCSALFIIE